MSLRSRLHSRDLAVVGVCTLLADVAVLAELPLLRILFGALLVLVLPGYALVLALLPAADSVERWTYAIGSSAIVVGLAGLVLNFSPFAITDATVLAVTNAVTFVSLTAVWRRRRRAPDAAEEATSADTMAGDEPTTSAGAAAGDEPATSADTVASDEPTTGSDLRSLLAFDTRTDQILTVLLLGTLLLATGSVAYAVTAPDQGKSYTELSLLTKNDGGEFVASGYPTEFVSGEPQSLYVGVANHEGESTTYTLVVAVQRVRWGDDSVEVLDEQQLDRRTLELGPGESKRIRHNVAPEMEGQGLRLAYMLYESTPPKDPTVENADQSVYLRIDVSESNETS